MSTNSARQSPVTKKPVLDWVFNMQIDQEGVPLVINTYRKKLNGFDYKKIMLSLKRIEKMKDWHQRDLAYLQFIEPVAELILEDKKSGILSSNFKDEDFFLSDICGYFMPVFESLNQYYLAVGAKGQMENLEDICRFIPDLDVFLCQSNLKLFKVRDEFLKILDEKGSFLHKDLKAIGSEYQLQTIENLINSLVNNNIIKKEKQGHYIVYMPKD